jgi:uncharacterized protein (TIGR02391 family)
MQLADLIPDVEVVLALEPDELGVRVLKVLSSWPRHQTLDLGTLINSTLGHPQTANSMPYPACRRSELEEAIRETWAWLVGAALLIPSPQYQGSEIMVLSRRARRLTADSDLARALRARRLPKESLHPKISDDVWQFFHRGKYDTAVFEAMKAVEVSVRAVAGLTPRDIGAALMRKAFDPDNGPLTDMAAEKAERDARSHLFAGAIGSYKSPQSPRHVALDNPDEAAEIIMLANHFLWIV